MRNIFQLAAMLLLAAVNTCAWGGKAPANAPPTVSITSPTSGATFTPPATITITANAADSNGTVARVEFYNGTTLLGTKTVAPYSHTWTSVPGGTYSLTAKAIDNAGAFASSAPVSVSVTGPQLTVVSPVNGSSTMDYSTTVTGTFAGDPSTTRVWVGNGSSSKLASINPANNQFSATMAILPGANTITTSVARIDKTSSTATVTVNGVQAPVVATLGPAQRTYLAPANVTFAVDAQSPHGSISKVDFINSATGGVLKSLTAPPYQHTWSGVPNGSYTVGVRATDARGGTSSVSIPFTVITAGAPTVSITSPSNNASYTAPANVTVTATAGTGDGKPATVAFYHDGVQFAATNMAPYSATLSNVSAGSYSLTARATDSFGVSTTSAPVTITVTQAGGGSNSVVQMTSPASGASYTSPAAINLAAAVPQNTVRVAYLRTDTGTSQEIGYSTTAPFTNTWNMRTPGTYTVVAQALVMVNGFTEPFTFTSEPITVVVKGNSSGETITYLHNDFLGSPVAATDVNGGLIWREDYNPYGERTENSSDASTNRQFFTGKPLDKETGLSYMNARYYDPHAGRFMAIDPVEFHETNIQSFNRYAYANNNPYKYVDPDGRLPVLVPLVIFVAKELAGEAFEAATGLPAPTVKNLGKGALKVGAKQFAQSSSKPGPKPRGVGPHNLKIQEIADDIIDKGGSIMAGGQRLEEKVVKTTGGFKDTRRPDILYRDAQGVVRGVNVGRVKADGVTPVTREVKALSDLNGPGQLPTTFVKYN